jgi:hypothetical protein
MLAWHCPLFRNHLSDPWNGMQSLAKSVMPHTRDNRIQGVVSVGK